MYWIEFNSDAYEHLNELSHQQPVIIFKYSYRCPVNQLALDRLQLDWKKEEMNGVKTYMLDIIGKRNLSNQLAEKFAVRHESPQILVIRDGQCVYHNSHMGINYDSIKNKIIAQGI